MSTHDSSERDSLEITCHQVKAKLDEGQDLVLLDCREPAEHHIVHLQGARLIPMNEIPDRLSELPAGRDAEIVVYCHHGFRSLQVATWLKQRGFDDVKSLAGGIDQWAIEIDPHLPRY